jgi:hypothetical protein
VAATGDVGPERPLAMSVVRNCSSALSALTLAAGLGSTAPHATAAETSNFPATLDRWMYPFAATPGTESAGSSFGAIGEDGFDDRDAQFLAGFTTSSSVAPGQGAANYHVASARLTVKIITGDAFAYDPTEDAVATYAPGGAADADAGRPVELYGVGYRGGFTAATFGETTPFSAAGGPAEGVRRAFAADYNGTTAVDVSNNVTGPDLDDDAANDAFDPNPWAVGTTPGVTPGANVPANALFTFDLDLSDPDVLAYVQRGLDAGDLRFALSSLHAATLGGPAPTYPRYYTRENTGPAAVPAGLEITLVPEPANAGALIGVAMALLAGRRLRRH